MKLFWAILEKFQAFGKLVASIINYLLLLAVYIVGVGLTWAGTRISRKQLLSYKSIEKTLWQDMTTDHSLRKAKRMF
ncbi:hypothetical protein HY490_02370 [Candidatus Woesearchaeota archaeon]|nr:hypothetical protein [Candidatus Woesearchaeota archaeon]